MLAIGRKPFGHLENGYDRKMVSGNQDGRLPGSSQGLASLEMFFFCGLPVKAMAQRRAVGAQLLIFRAANADL